MPKAIVFLAHVPGRPDLGGAVGLVAGGAPFGLVQVRVRGETVLVPVAAVHRVRKRHPAAPAATTPPATAVRRPERRARARVWNRGRE